MNRGVYELGNLRTHRAKAARAEARGGVGSKHTKEAAHGNGDDDPDGELLVRDGRTLRLPSGPKNETRSSYLSL